MDIGNLCTLDDFLTAEWVRGRGKTVIETLCEREWPKVRKVFVGDLEDLQQSLVVALLEWHRDSGSPDRIDQIAAADHLKSVLARTVLDNRRKEFLQQELGTEAGEFENPPDHLTPERARALQSLIDAISQQCGTVGAYVLKGRLLHGLSWKEMSKRLRWCQPRPGEPTDYRERNWLGYSNNASVKITPHEVEVLFFECYVKLKELAKSGTWETYNKYFEKD